MKTVRLRHHRFTVRRYGLRLAGHILRRARATALSLARWCTVRALRASGIRALALVDAMRNCCGRRLAAPLGLSATSGLLVRSSCC
ncbi:hypothetical protein J2858_000804 [Neorhizobium galegae]|uniref:hypothetical protein n=1 Tax=Neorhizobium galegae TaxID=399 RepID=UPI001AE6E02D|nr:hypothetical protein [Neorhizobium galegae]MBP2547911.1 hypothetical protein [Neorhizobium galegae]